MAEIDVRDFVAALEGACAEMLRHKEELTRLDAAIGDGDLGVTVELGCRAVREGLTSLANADIGTVLAKSGMNFSRAASSTFGVLVTSAFLEAGKNAAGLKALAPADLVRIGRGVVAAIERRGKAQPGDKTMLDAIGPAVDALEEANGAGQNLLQALDSAVRGAETGVKATIGLKSKYGRAAWLGDKSIGVQDPGATAVWLFLQSFVSHLTARLNAHESQVQSRHH